MLVPQIDVHREAPLFWREFDVAGSASLHWIFPLVTRFHLHLSLSSANLGGMVRSDLHRLSAGWCSSNFEVCRCQVQCGLEAAAPSLPLCPGEACSSG